MECDTLHEFKRFSAQTPCVFTNSSVAPLPLSLWQSENEAVRDYSPSFHGLRCTSTSTTSGSLSMMRRLISRPMSWPCWIV